MSKSYPAASRILSPTNSSPITQSSCKHRPKLVRPRRPSESRISWPEIVELPFSRGINPAAASITVDLPHPFSPERHTTSPLFTESDHLSKTLFRPRRTEISDKSMMPIKPSEQPHCLQADASSACTWRRYCLRFGWRQSSDL